MSQYVRTNGALGAAYDPFQGGQASDFKWVPGGPTGFTCTNMRTGAPYTGGLTTFPCGARPSSSGGGAVYDFLKKTFLPQTGPGYGGPGAPPSVTASSLLLPAVAVVGVVGVLLILKKKK